MPQYYHFDTDNSDAYYFDRFCHERFLLTHSNRLPLKRFSEFNTGDAMYSALN